jgi:hypothetical protein
VRLTPRSAVAVVAGAGALLVAMPGTGYAIPVLEDVKIVPAVSPDYKLVVSVGSVQKPSEVFDITIARVNGAGATSSCSSTTACSLPGGGSPSQPAVFVVNAVGHTGPTADTLGTVFDSFQLTGVCTTATSCTFTPTV